MTTLEVVLICVVCVMTGGGIAAAVFYIQSRRRQRVMPSAPQVAPQPPVRVTEMTNVQPIVVDAKPVGAAGEYALQDAAQFARAPVVMATPVPVSRF